MSLIEEAKILQLNNDIEMLDESAGGWWVALVALFIAKMSGVATTITHMIIGNRPDQLIKVGDHLDKDAINQQIHDASSKVTDLKDQIDTLLDRVSVPGILPANHVRIDNAIDQVISDVSNHGKGWLNNDHLHSITKEFGHIDHVLSHWHDHVPAIVQQTFDTAKQKSEELIKVARDGEHIRSRATISAHATATDNMHNSVSEYQRNYTATHQGIEVALLLLSFFVIFKLWQAVVNSESDSKLKSKSNIKNVLSITPKIIRSFKKALK